MRSYSSVPFHSSYDAQKYSSPSSKEQASVWLKRSYSYSSDPYKMSYPGVISVRSVIVYCNGCFFLQDNLSILPHQVEIIYWCYQVINSLLQKAKEYFRPCLCHLPSVFTKSSQKQIDVEDITHIIIYILYLWLPPFLSLTSSPCYPLPLIFPLTLLKKSQCCGVTPSLTPHYFVIFHPTLNTSHFYFRPIMLHLNILHKSQWSLG